MVFFLSLCKRWLTRILMCAGAAIAALSATANDSINIRSMLEFSPKKANMQLDTNISGRLAGEPKTLHSSLLGATGRQQIIVRLKSTPTSGMPEESVFSSADQKYFLESEQSGFVQRSQTRHTSIRVIGRVQHVLNAVFLDVPAEALTEIAADPFVVRVAPVSHYKMDLSETVPYIGATAVQNTGFTGKNVTVGVIDSGIDYTHADLGGSGDPNDYLNNNGDIIEPGSFPTKKVVGGYDFLGSVWPTGPGGSDDPPMPDPDPFDDFFAGHGTHVADIIGGVNGVAPDAELYALKACASQTTSCNGIALVLAVDYAVDPNKDGDTSDHLDILNLSLGASYGSAFDDDLSTAIDNASALGVLTVASAGNCDDKPYCTGSPASAPTALSVAQTNVPSATGYFMAVLEPALSAGLYDAVKYAWTGDLTESILGPVQYGDIDGSNLDGCLPFSGDFSGAIVAVDRGSCAFSEKIRNIENAGAKLGIVMLITPDAPFPGAFAGGDPISIPGFNISQADGDIIRSGQAIVEFSPDLSFSLLGTTVSSSARGPDLSFNAIKPEIAAPGASVSAEVGTGTGRTAFGGTSGASPMVAGSAALLLERCLKTPQSHPYYRNSIFHKRKMSNCSPHIIKALLVNNGDTNIESDTTNALAEITRIGGGEVRVQKSSTADIVAFTPKGQQPVLSLGFVDADAPRKISRKLTLKNLSNRVRFVYIEPTFRFDEDAQSGAIDIKTPKRWIAIAPRRSKTVNVDFYIRPDMLPGNSMNSGSEGNNPAALTASEFDGYLVLHNWRGDDLTIPWHIIPRQAAKVQASSEVLNPEAFPDTIELENNGAGAAQIDAYSIIALSDETPKGERGRQTPTPDIRAVGVSTILVDPSICSAEFLWLFAINTWDRQSHLAPVSHQITFDINKNGIDDYVLLNRDLTLNDLSDGRQLSWVVDLATGDAVPFFFAEHASNTGNTVLYACGEQLGLSSADLGVTSVNISVEASDFFFGGPGDVIEGLTVTPFAERYLGVTGDIAANNSGTLELYDFGTLPGNSPESGLMLLTNGDRGAGMRGGATEASEALFILSPEVKAPQALP